MKLVHGETPKFEDFEVLVRRETIEEPKWIWSKSVTSVKWIPMQGVLEADDATGLVVAQVFNPDGYPIFSNGLDEIYIDNSTKLLLLVPSIKEVFLRSGFLPKLTRSFEKIRIVNKSSTKPLPEIKENSPEQAGHTRTGKVPNMPNIPLPPPRDYDFGDYKKGDYKKKE